MIVLYRITWQCPELSYKKPNSLKGKFQHAHNAENAEKRYLLNSQQNAKQADTGWLNSGTELPTKALICIFWLINERSALSNHQLSEETFLASLKRLKADRSGHWICRMYVWPLRTLVQVVYWTYVETYPMDRACCVSPHTQNILRSISRLE